MCTKMEKALELVVGVRISGRITDCVDSLQETQHPYNRKTLNRRSMCLVPLIEGNSVDDLKAYQVVLSFPINFYNTKA